MAIQCGQTYHVNNVNSSYLSPFFNDLFKALIENAYRTDYEGTSADLALGSFTALFALCENAAPDTYPNLYEMLFPIL